MAGFGTYLMNHGVRPVDHDLAQPFSPTSLADVVWASPPCPPWSLMGPKTGLRDPRGRLMLHLCRIFEAHGAAVLVCEQSPHMVNVNGGRGWELIQQTFTSRGHSLQCHRLDSAHYGVPQSRVRLFLIVTRAGLQLKVLAFVSRPSSTLSQVLKRPAAITRARTIRSSGGGGRSSDPRAFKKVPLVSKECYVLQLRDMVRLQGFPRNFRFPKDLSAKAKQRLVGNAVPPPTVAVVLAALRDALVQACHQPVRFEPKGCEACRRH